MADHSSSHKSMPWYDVDQQHCTHGSPTSFQIFLKSEKPDGVTQERGRHWDLSVLVLIIVAVGQQAVGLTPDGTGYDYGAVVQAVEEW